jgi:hypothetical protein
MRSNNLTNLLLLIIAVCLAAIAIGPLFQPLGVHGQSTATSQIPMPAFSQLAPADPVTLIPGSSGPYFLDPTTRMIWG